MCYPGEDDIKKIGPFRLYECAVARSAHVHKWPASPNV